MPVQQLPLDFVVRVKYVGHFSKQTLARKRRKSSFLELNAHVLPTCICMGTAPLTLASHGNFVYTFSLQMQISSPNPYTTLTLTPTLTPVLRWSKSSTYRKGRRTHAILTGFPQRHGYGADGMFWLGMGLLCTSKSHRVGVCVVRDAEKGVCSRLEQD